MPAKRKRLGLMRILFIHQNMPGQFTHLARALASDSRNQVVFVTRRKDRQIENVERVSYTLRLPRHQDVHQGAEPFGDQVFHGEAVIRACQALRVRGFSPDIIVGHPGWGELLFVKDLFPDIPLVSYCEFYYNPRAEYHQGDPPKPLDLDERIKRHAQSAHLLLSLEAADFGWSPTEWQKSLHPAAFHPKIHVIFEGVNTRVIRPNSRARFTLPDGSILDAGQEVITYAARSLEPCRGFPSFVRAIPKILSRRPSAQVVIAGEAVSHYDAPPLTHQTWRDALQDEVRLDPKRVHFVGGLPHKHFLQLLQVSRVHVYLTTPIVLSWSVVEAMSAGCLVVASNTAPVREIITAEHNGLLKKFDEPDQIAADVERALGHGTESELRRNARSSIKQTMALDVCLPRQAHLLQEAARSKGRSAVSLGR